MTHKLRGDLHLNAKSEIPYEWLKSIDPKLLELDNHPLFGYCPAFPWKEFSEKLAKSFELESIKIEPGELRWREASEITQDLGDNLHVQQVSISTIEGKSTFVIDKEDLRFIMFALLKQSRPKELKIYDDEIEKGFYRYLALEAVRCFSESDFDKTLSLHLLKEDSLPDEASLGWDIQISLMKRTVTARLILSPEFQKSFKQHFAERKLSKPVSREFLKNTEIALHLEVGRVSITQDELKKLKVGDLILLDRSYIDPETHQGQAVLTLNGTPKIKASLEKNTLKIEKGPLFQEEAIPSAQGEAKE